MERKVVADGQVHWEGSAGERRVEDVAVSAREAVWEEAVVRPEGPRCLQSRSPGSWRARPYAVSVGSRLVEDWFSNAVSQS